MPIQNDQITQEAKKRTAQVSDPSTVAGEGAVYPKDVAGVTELFYAYDGQAPIQITENGVLKVPPSGASVTSVNTQTGAVVLDADDISDATTTNKFASAAELSKLAGIQAGAEVNPDVVSQAEAEAGTATIERTWTAQRVAQAIAALAGGGGSVSVSDDGASVVATASTFNFTGAGVTVTDAGGGQANIAIPGGGGSTNEFVIVLPAATTIANRIADIGAVIPAGLTLYQGDNGSVDSDLGAGAEDLVIAHTTGGLPYLMTAFVLEGPFNTKYKRLDFETVGANTRLLSNPGKTQVRITALGTQAADADKIEIFVRFV